MRPRSLLANTLALLTGNVGSAALAFALAALIGRALGETGLGVYAAVLGWTFPLLMLAEFGTNTLLTRDLATATAQTATYLRATDRVRVGFGSVLTVLLVVAAPIVSDDPIVVAGLRVAAPLLLLEPAYGAYTAVFRAHRAMTPIPLLNNGMLAAQLLLTSVVLWRGGDVVTVLGVNTLTSGGRMLAAWWIYRAQFRRIDIAPLPGGAGFGVRTNLLQHAWPFAIAGVLAAAHMRLNVVLLEGIAGAAAAGLYAAAIRFVEATRMIPHALFDALMPQLTALRDDQAAFRRTFRRAALWISGFGVMVAGGAWGGGRALVTLAYGDAFADAAPVLFVAAALLAPALLRQLLVLHAYALDAERAVNRAYGVMLVVGLAAGFVLISRYGAVGAAWNWGIAEVAGLLVLLAHTRRHQTPVHSGNITRDSARTRSASSSPKKKRVSRSASPSDANL